MFLSAGDATVAVDALRHVKEQLRAVPMRAGYGIARYLGRDAGITAALERQPPAPVRFNYLGQADRVLADDTGWKPVLDFQASSTARAHVAAICSRSTGWCSTAACA